MRKDDAEILRGIQKNTKTAMKAIDVINDKIYDDDLAMQLARQNVRYSEIYNEATNKLLDAQEDTYHGGGFNERVVMGSIKANTFLNTSTSHLAEVVIGGCNRGVVEMCKILNQNENARGMYVEMAKELMDFEEHNIERLKKYL
ncbi:MAG: hypothetical protein FWE14_01865 [Lachnospiraceae bacterium]|nr:hypothetical protein [Lachnospiraceae bacterium]